MGREDQRSMAGSRTFTPVRAGLISFACLCLVPGLNGATGATARDQRPVIAATAQGPLAFERATSGDARWMARGNGYRLAVGAADVEVGLRDERLRILFVGADAKAPSAGLEALPGKVNYFVGSDPKAWLRDVSTYGRVRYSGVYPGVDVVCFGRSGEYLLEPSQLQVVHIEKPVVSPSNQSV